MFVKKEPPYKTRLCMSLSTQFGVGPCRKELSLLALFSRGKQFLRIWAWDEVDAGFRDPPSGNNWQKAMHYYCMEMRARGSHSHHLPVHVSCRDQCWCTAMSPRNENVFVIFRLIKWKCSSLFDKVLTSHHPGNSICKTTHRNDLQ
jgi:hypothetical protein